MADYGGRIREAYDDNAQGHHAKLMDPADSAWNVFERYRMLEAIGDKCFGRSVLDLGCGSGVTTGEFVRKGAAKVVGVDFSEGQVRIAGKEIPEAHFLAGDAAAIPLPDSEFDVAVSSYLINNLGPEELARHFREVSRVLKPGGRYYFSTGHPSFDGNEVSEDGLLVRDYFTREKFDLNMMSKGKRLFRIDSYHRTFDALTEATAAAGLLIERILEPRPPGLIKDLDKDYFGLATEFPTLYIGVAIKA